jgi:hypothetical protein
MPIVFRFLAPIAASTAGMALRIGNGDSAASSRTQKCPPIEVIAAASARAAANRFTRRRKISACLRASPLARFFPISRTSACAIVTSGVVPAAACRSIRPR